MIYIERKRRLVRKPNDSCDSDVNFGSLSRRVAGLPTRLHLRLNMNALVMLSHTKSWCDSSSQETESKRVEQGTIGLDLQI